MDTFQKEDWLALLDCINSLIGPIIEMLKQISS